MANTFKSSVTSNLSTSLSTIYAAPTSAAGVAISIGIAFANKTNTAVTVNVAIVRGGTQFYLINTGVVPVGGTLTIAGVDQKVVLQQNDLLQASASIASSIDATVSVLEIT